MNIYFKRNRLAKILNNQKLLVRNYGSESALKIGQRLAELSAAKTLFDISYLPPARRHELIGRDKGKFAVDVKGPLRIIFEPAHNPIPTKEDGGIDLLRVTDICILDVKNYHK